MKINIYSFFKKKISSILLSKKNIINFSKRKKNRKGKNKQQTTVYIGFRHSSTIHSQDSAFSNKTTLYFAVSSSIPATSSYIQHLFFLFITFPCTFSYLIILILIYCRHKHNQRERERERRQIPRTGNPLRH